MRILLSIFAVLLLLSGCSIKPSLELISSSAEINDDGSIHINDGEKESKYVDCTQLSYHFVLKNTSIKTIGKTKNEAYEDKVNVVIEPNKGLQAVSEEVLGSNLFTEGGISGWGSTSSPVIKPNQEGEYTFDFNLGALEKNPAISLAPSQEQLGKLLESSMDATLVVYIGDKEIARFDLSK